MKYSSITLLITLLLTQLVISKSSITTNKISKSFMKISNKKIYPDGFFNIIGKTGFCVSATEHYKPLTQQYCGPADHLQWKVENHKDGLVILSKNGLAMDNFENRNGNGNKTIGYQRNNTSAQVWLIESVNNGNHVHFRNPHTNRCFDDTGKAGVGRTYHIWDCSNINQNQWFRLVYPKIYPDGFFNIIGKKGFCVSATEHYKPLTQQKCGTADHLKWKVENHKDGLVILSKNGLAMDNLNNTNGNGNQTIGYQRNNTSAQVWLIESVKNGNHVHFRNPYTNRCFDDTGVAVVGRTYHIWDCSNDNQNQWFSLNPVI
jgi:hypothetical protein